MDPGGAFVIWPFKKAELQTPKSWYPAAYVADPQRPDVFDPALKHYRRAFVKGPPKDAANARRLTDARSLLLRRTARALARSPLADVFVLRGSFTLWSWFGGRARRPRDLDLVVRDAALAPDGPGADALLARVAGNAVDALAGVEAHVLLDEIA